MRGLGGVPSFYPDRGTLEGVTPGILGDVEEEARGAVADVDIFCLGSRISGRVQIGGFDRLSGWINMQSGFIAVRELPGGHPGQTDAMAPNRPKGPLWVRLEQIVMIGEKSSAMAPHPGTPFVEKQQRRVSITAHDYRLEGDLHIHTYGTIAHLLQSPDVRFIPMTDVTVRGLSSESVVARFPFAMVNREQLVTVADAASLPGSHAVSAARDG